MCNPIAFGIEMMGDIVYFHRLCNRRTTVTKKANGHIDNQSWELVMIDDIPKNAEIIP